MHLLKKKGDVEEQEEYTHSLRIQFGVNHGHIKYLPLY